MSIPKIASHPAWNGLTVSNNQHRIVSIFYKIYLLIPFRKYIVFWQRSELHHGCKELIKTRTTRTPTFWGYPPPPHDYPHYWVILDPKSKNNWSRTENVTERTRFSKSRSNDQEDIGQGQRSSHATDLLMLVIICTKYGKNPSRTVDAPERTQFSRSRPNDLENIGQGQRSLHVTHPLMLMIICAKCGKNASRIVDFFQGESQKIRKICEKFKF